ncbi:unnamed protein product [Closterium sp. Naga37s-1]|nr:unnamed protein product [Closterium sp. Naga37s-1]
MIVIHSFRTAHSAFGACPNPPGRHHAARRVASPNPPSSQLQIRPRRLSQSALVASPNRPRRISQSPSSHLPIALVASPNRPRRISQSPSSHLLIRPRRTSTPPPVALPATSPCNIAARLCAASHPGRVTSAVTSPPHRRLASPLSFLPASLPCPVPFSPPYPPLSPCHVPFSPPCPPLLPLSCPLLSPLSSPLPPVLGPSLPPCPVPLPPYSIWHNNILPALVLPSPLSSFPLPSHPFLPALTLNRLSAQAIAPPVPLPLLSLMSPPPSPRFPPLCPHSHPTFPSFHPFFPISPLLSHDFPAPPFCHLRLQPRDRHGTASCTFDEMREMRPCMRHPSEPFLSALRTPNLHTSLILSPSRHPLSPLSSTLSPLSSSLPPVLLSPPCPPLSPLSSSLPPVLLSPPCPPLSPLSSVPP